MRRQLVAAIQTTTLLQEETACRQSGLKRQTLKTDRQLPQDAPCSTQRCAKVDELCVGRDVQRGPQRRRAEHTAVQPAVEADVGVVVHLKQSCPVPDLQPAAQTTEVRLNEALGVQMRTWLAATHQY